LSQISISLAIDDKFIEKTIAEQILKEFLLELKRAAEQMFSFYKHINKIERNDMYSVKKNFFFITFYKF
jgi:hypothetical protein